MVEVMTFGSCHWSTETQETLMPWTFGSARRRARTLRRAPGPHEEKTDHSAAAEGATVPVTVVASKTEADLIIGMLRSYDVRAAVSADDVGGQEPALQGQGVRVLVAPSDAALARQLLAAVEDPSSVAAPPESTDQAAKSG
jgi:hypothetical protein